MEYLTVTTTSVNNFKDFSSWLLSCLLALALIYVAFGAMYPAYGAASEENMREIADSYYKAIVAEDDVAAYQNFSTDALFSIKADFGLMYPDYEVEFRADDMESFDESIFKGYEVVSTVYTIDNIELTETGALISATVRQPYRWSGYTGTMTARENLTIDTVSGVFLITRMESTQEYK